MEVVVISIEDLREIIRNEFKDLTPANPAIIHPSTKYNVEEAAAYLNMPVPSFRSHQHRIGGSKIGKRWVFTKLQLDNFIELNRRKTPQEIREAV